ncbi:hypothetical protein [Ornithinibacillus contaminans]|nr:hypothetical protein [Ornithinibacillus contaminans]
MNKQAMIFFVLGILLIILSTPLGYTLKRFSGTREGVFIPFEE